MNLISKISTLIPALALAMAPLVPAVANAQSVSADVGVSVNASTTSMLHHNSVASSSLRRASTTAATEGKIVDRSDTDIDARITALQQVSARLAGEKLLPPSSLATLQASISAEISSLTSLKAQINSDDSTTTLKADASSITKSYRIYMLVLPQDKLTSAADRVLAVATQMQELSAKFATRISEAGTVSSSVTSAKADFDAKVADSQTQADSAVSVISDLQPDNGDATVMASNTAALKAALQSIKNAQQDLVSARADATVIVNGLAGKRGASGSVSASTTSSVNP